MKQEPDERPDTSQSFLSPQDARLERLRELRRQRQQLGTGPLFSGEIQRHGLPTPPPAQPPLQELIKHWWRNGPFSGRQSSADPTTPQAQRRETGPIAPPLPTKATPYEERAKELLAQGRKGLAIASAKAQEMMNQAKSRLSQKMQSQPKPARVEGVVPGFIIIGFAPTIPRQEAVRAIHALGGKPLRHKASLNLYQVAVPPGQEQAMIHQFLRQPGVVSADLERSQPR